MSYKRISRARKRELDAPDEFVTVSSQIVKYASENAKQLMVGAATVIVLIILLSGLKYYSMQTEKKAGALLGQAMEKLEKGTAEDKNPQALYADLKPVFERLMEEYPGKHAAKTGRLIYASLCMKANAYAPAVMAYTEALKDYKNDSFYTHQIQKSLACAYEEQKKYEEAIAEMETLLAAPQVQMKGEVLLQLGRLYAATGQKDKEAENLKKIVAEFPNSTYAGVAREKLRIANSIN